MTGRAWHGVGWTCAHVDGRRASRVDALVARPVVLDPVGIDAAWGLRAPAPERTVVADVRRIRPKLAATGASVDVGVVGALEAAVARIAASARAPVVALGGGLDAAAVLLAWRRAVGSCPPVITLATGWSDYDEVDDARDICRHLGAELDVVTTHPDAILDAVAAAVGAAEAPLYNLHPVGRWIVAREAARRGHDVLVTGDGADAVFIATPDHDYVPLVVAMTERAGLRHASPFFDEDLVAAGRGLGPDKRPLRDYLQAHEGPAWLSERPKRPRRMPALDVLGRADRIALRDVARRVGRPLRLDDDRRRVGWTTLAALVGGWEGT